MLYVLLILVVALAMLSGALYAILKLSVAEHRAEIAKLNCKIEELKRKLAVKEGLR